MLPDPVGHSTFRPRRKREEAPQALDQQKVDRHPDGAAPIRVAAEQTVSDSPAIVHAYACRCTRSRRGGRDRSAESARTPYGERNSVSSSMRRKTWSCGNARQREQVPLVRRRVVPARDELRQIAVAVRGNSWKFRQKPRQLAR